MAPAHDKKITTDAVGTAYHAEESNPVPEKTEEQPWQMILRHPRLGVYAMLINIGPLLFGYDMVIIGAVSALPQFKIDFGDNFGASYVIPALWVALWNSFLQIGAGIGSASAGAYQDRYGRRATVFLGGLLGCIGAAVSYVSGMPATMTERRISFMFAKAILGASCGFLMSACQTYISETSPRDLRGLFLGFYAFNVSLGHLLAISVVFSQSYGSKASSYMNPFASQWALGGWAIVVSFVLPESPVWIAGRNEIEKAKKSLRRLGTEQMLPDIVRTMETERDELGAGDATPSYKECFQGTNLRRTLIVMFLSTIQQFVGW
ncbi:MFS transporter fmqE [Colletotrichum viniferum]|nr:MFS transporter fmqE [Colletotrichum viniferum]